MTSLLCCTVSDFMQETKAAPIITVNKDMSALEAFRVIYMAKISAAPIVQDEEVELLKISGIKKEPPHKEKNRIQKIVGTISASDLRGLTLQSLELLLMPVYDYLEQIRFLRNATLSTNTAPAAAASSILRQNSVQLLPDQLRVVTGENLLSDAMRIVLENGIHRVWVISGQDEIPIGVLTLTDMLSNLIPVNK